MVLIVGAITKKLILKYENVSRTIDLRKRKPVYEQNGSVILQVGALTCSEKNHSHLIITHHLTIQKSWK
ncbi:hypothetical protein, partial [Leptospira stimsonii]